MVQRVCCGVNIMYFQQSYCLYLQHVDCNQLQSSVKQQNLNIVAVRLDAKTFLLNLEKTCDRGTLFNVYHTHTLNHCILRHKPSGITLNMGVYVQRGCTRTHCTSAGYSQASTMSVLLHALTHKDTALMHTTQRHF